MYHPSFRSRADRRGAAAVEFALLLPLLGVLFLASVDFARLYYHYGIVTNCARNGALYASDPTAAQESNYPNLQAAALADATDLSPQPTVTSTNGTDSAGNPFVEVTVTYSFPTIGVYPVVSNPVTLSRTVQMRVVQAAPN